MNQCRKQVRQEHQSRRQLWNFKTMERRGMKASWDISKYHNIIKWKNVSMNTHTKRTTSINWPKRNRIQERWKQELRGQSNTIESIITTSIQEWERRDQRQEGQELETRRTDMNSWIDTRKKKQGHRTWTKVSYHHDKHRNRQEETGKEMLEEERAHQQT